MRRCEQLGSGEGAGTQAASTDVNIGIGHPFRTPICSEFIRTTWRLPNYYVNHAAVALSTTTSFDRHPPAFQAITHVGYGRNIYRKEAKNGIHQSPHG